MLKLDHLFIGGQWIPPTSAGTIDVISPHSEEVVGRAPLGAAPDVDRAVKAARSSFETGDWSRADVKDRIAAVSRLADLYAARMPELAALVSEEMGSPISFAQLAQAPPAWLTLTAFLTIAETYPWVERRPGLLGSDVTIQRESVGVVAAIAPWNFPQGLTMSKLAPALLAGCSIVVKPALETPLDALVLAGLVEEAGIPEGVVSVVTGGPEVGDHLVRHPGVDKVAFTGSTAVGRQIASICGQQLKRMSLELGGKSAAIILDDADLAETMAGLKVASLMNNGQVCTAQSRILAPRHRYQEVVDAVAEMTAGLRVGDPADPDTEIGPLVSGRHRERVEGYIALGLQEGASLVVGGTGRPDVTERGWYVRPTVFAGVDNAMRIAREEIFGPVLVVIPYKDDDEAVRIANDSDYGLAGSVWTDDLDRGLEVAGQVRAGTFGINQYTIDFAAPFGGYKASGLGREWGREGFEEYLEFKAILAGGGVKLG